MGNLTDAYAASAAYTSPENPDTVYIPVPSKAIKDLQDMKPGDEVHILIVGKLMAKSERVAYKGQGFNGAVDVELRRIAIAADQDTLEDLLDD